MYWPKCTADFQSVVQIVLRTSSPWYDFIQRTGKSVVPGTFLSKRNVSFLSYQPLKKLCSLRNSKMKSRMLL